MSLFTCVRFFAQAQRERISNAEGYPLLSCQDVVTMLEFYLPKRDVTEDEIFRQLKARHRKREKN
jgi:hypothetical protein